MADTVDPVLKELLRNAKCIETLQLLPIYTLQAELESRALSKDGKKAECAQRLVDDNLRSPPPPTTSTPLRDVHQGRGMQDPSETNRSDLPNVTLPSVSSIARQPAETSEDFCMRLMSHTFAEFHKESSRIVEVHTTPDISNTLPTFSAKPGEKAAEFIRTVNHTSLQQHWSPTVTVGIAASKLRLEAKAWHGATGIDYEDDWTAWKNAFLAHFGKELSFVEWQKEVEKRVQTEDETISAYIQAKLKLFKSSRYGENLTLTDKVDIICQGIRNEATRTHLWGRHATMEDFIETARIRQRHDQFVASKAEKIPMKAAESKSVTDKDKKVSAKADERDHSAVQDEDDIRNSSAPTSTSTQTDEKKKDKPVFRRRQTDRTGDPCYNCEEHGHIARYCPKPKTSATIEAEARREKHEETPTKPKPASKRQISCFVRSTLSDLPVVIGKLYGVEVRICIDSGANVSAVRAASIPDGVKSYPWIGGEPIKVLDSTYMPDSAIIADIELGDTRVLLPNVIRTDSCPFDVLLGSDWRRFANVDVMFHKDNDVTIVNLNDEKTQLGDHSHPTSRIRAETLIVSSWQTPPKDISVSEEILLSTNAESFEVAYEQEEKIDTTINSASFNATDEKRESLHGILQHDTSAFVTTDESLGLSAYAEPSIELRDTLPIGTENDLAKKVLPQVFDDVDADTSLLKKSSLRETNKTPERKETGKKKRKKRSYSDARDPHEGEDGYDSVPSAEVEFPNMKEKSKNENDYLKETLANDLRDNSSHGNLNKVKREEVQQRSGDEKDREAEVDEGDGNATCEESQAIDELLRIPLDKKTSRASDTDEPSANDYNPKKRRRLSVNLNDRSKTWMHRRKKRSSRKRCVATSSFDPNAEAGAKRLTCQNQGRKVRKRRRIININSSSDGSYDSDRDEKGATSGNEDRLRFTIHPSRPPDAGRPITQSFTIIVSASDVAQVPFHLGTRCKVKGACQQSVMHSGAIQRKTPELGVYDVTKNDVQKRSRVMASE